MPKSPLSPNSTNGANADYFTSPKLESIIEHVQYDHQPTQRNNSISSITFRGNSKSRPSIDGKVKSKSASATRIRGASPPPPPKFQSKVSFDNIASLSEPTERNTISFTLNAKHKGYQYKRRSRTFMVGIDENSYSDIALQWMLEELVDDGDEIICLRVVDKDSKITTDRALEKKQYQQEARDLLKSIQKKNDDNRAISIVLEFAVGKVHTTFQKMIQIYEPAMLIVGTRGRSLGGFQGLVGNRNSFSKWCLQYSPIPVVVVRPTEKRLKKKQKREIDPLRQSYARLLQESGVDLHETQVVASNLEEPIGPLAEAHAVAAALGLPAAFDPTLKPFILDGSRALKKVDSGKSEETNYTSGPDSRPSSPDMLMKSPRSAQLDSPMMSGDEYSENEEDEFEAMPGHLLLDNNRDEPNPEVEKKKKLHEMELEEAKALGRKASTGSTESDGREGDGGGDSK
ncbi:Universal stress family domain protein [Rutstroemia sp. NJR-2017a BVV2]|nr:Universal stress family domain protein [Rutstroemia sp. NJR-2017a BVV2]